LRTGIVAGCVRAGVTDLRTEMARSAAVLAKILNLKRFVGFLPPAATQNLKVGGGGFQNVNQPLRSPRKPFASLN
jgi:hypothetical protein